MKKNNPTSSEIFLTPTQAAVMLNVSIATLKKFIYQGIVKTLKTPGGHHRILKRDLLKLTSTYTLRVPYGRIIDKALPEIAKEMVCILEKKLKFCHGHAASVSEMSFRIGQKLKLSTQDLNKLRLVALLHDIGKFWIDEHILDKPSELTAQEYALIKTHPLIGEDILGSIRPFRKFSMIARQHHERLDGNGYPDGLKGNDICLEAKIIALADAYDAMVSLNSYKKPLPVEEAVAEIKRNAGTQFDPHVTEAFLSI